MKIVCDKNMPYVEESFSTLGDVVSLSGRDISAADVRDAEMLITRSTTQVNEQLLRGSSVRFYGSGVIGVDHIDLEYLRHSDIKVATAPGCNAVSVGNYITAALLWLSGQFDFELDGLTIGVIGVGNVGRQVCRFADALGMRILANDPPRQRDSNDLGAVGFATLEQVLRDSDIITCHVPLNRVGLDRTEHLIGAEQIAAMKDGVILLNAARGAVVDNQALLSALNNGKIAQAVIDCWEGEPLYRADLMERVALGTPHIAGHAFEGKVNGTAMIYQQACEYLGVQPSYAFELPQPPVPLVTLDAQERSDEDVLREIVLRVYDIQSDSDRLRSTVAEDDQGRITAFDGQRSKYPMRRQFESTVVKVANASDKLLAKIKLLDFKVANMP